MKKVLLMVLSAVSLHIAHAQTEFVTVWKTDNAGLSASNQVSIPGSSTYNIQWENVNNPAIQGTVAGNNTTVVTFPAAGTYRVKMRPVLPNTIMNFHIRADGQINDALKLLLVEQWGTSTWGGNMSSAFSGCRNLDITATDIPDFSQVTNMVSMFYDCSSLIGNATFNNWNVANVIHMTGMFYLATRFNQPLSNWNTANVKNMAAMFWRASGFNQPLNSWNVANVTDMNSMFGHATSFNQPLDDWNTGNVADMSQMYSGASGFNQSLGAWNLSRVTNMKEMLSNAGMDCSRYDSTLIGWANASATPGNVSLGAASLVYSSEAAVTARANLVSKGWTITGDSHNPVCNEGVQAPDLTPNTELGFTTFAREGAARNLLVQLQEIKEVSTRAGVINFSVVVSSGYTLSFNPALTAFTPSGTSAVTVQNDKWTATSQLGGARLTFQAKAGTLITAKSIGNLGITITRSGATAGTTGSVTVIITADSSGTGYDSDAANNAVTRPITAQ